MRCERIAGLGRHLANLNKNASDTYAAQWFERTLDDSTSYFTHYLLNTDIRKAQSVGSLSQRCF